MNTKKSTLKNIPEDIFRFILIEQNRIKEERNIVQYSFEQTIYSLLRATDKFKKFTESQNSLVR